MADISEEEAQKLYQKYCERYRAAYEEMMDLVGEDEASRQAVNLGFSPDHMQPFDEFKANLEKIPENNLAEMRRLLEDRPNNAERLKLEKLGGLFSHGKDYFERN